MRKMVIYGLGCLISTAFCCAPAFADTYNVTVNSSSINGTSGWIDLQFSEPGVTPGPGIYSELADATVSNFSTDGTLLSSLDSMSSPQVFGDVTGALPGDVAFSALDDGATNEYTQAMTFGNTISFTLDITGQAISSPSCPGTSGTDCSLPGFVLDFLNSDQSGYLLTNDPTGSTPTGWVTGGVNVNEDGTTTSYVNPGPDGGAADVTFSAVAAPEPSSLLMLSLGLLGLGLILLLKRLQHEQGVQD
jgi:hypothetical protein